MLQIFSSSFFFALQPWKSEKHVFRRICPRITRLNTICGVNMGVIGRWTSGQMRLAHFLSIPMLKCRLIFSILQSFETEFTCVDMNKGNIMKAFSAQLLFCLVAIVEQSFVYSSQFMQTTDMGLCMLMHTSRHIHKLYARHVSDGHLAVRTFHDFDSSQRPTLELW